MKIKIFFQGSRPQSALSNVSRPSTPGLRAHTPVYPSSPKTIVFPPPNPYQQDEEPIHYDGYYDSSNTNTDIENLNNQVIYYKGLMYPSV